jgi:hypothetical protein
MDVSYYFDHCILHIVHFVTINFQYSSFIYRKGFGPEVVKLSILLFLHRSQYMFNRDIKVTEDTNYYNKAQKHNGMEYNSTVFGSKKIKRKRPSNNNILCF